MNRKTVTASFLIIGDEILSGRTHDKNLPFLANNLTKIGIILKEVRVVPDNEDRIINSVKELKNKYDYLFTSGGIGPTHDDITIECIGKACGDEIVKNIEAEKLLINYYGESNVNEARLKMAYLPSTATLLDNPISSAPGFRIENIFVMAGIPAIFEVMFNAARKQLETGDIIKSVEIRLGLTESVIAKIIKDIQDSYLGVALGSYPFTGGTSIVIRSVDEGKIEQAKNELVNSVQQIDKNAILGIF